MSVIPLETLGSVGVVGQVLEPICTQENELPVLRFGPLKTSTTIQRLIDRDQKSLTITLRSPVFSSRFLRLRSKENQTRISVSAKRYPPYGHGRLTTV